MTLFLSLAFILLTVSLFIFINSIFNHSLGKENKYVKKFIWILWAWLIFMIIISQMHFLDNWNVFPPRLILIVFPPLIASLIFTFSKKSDALIKGISQEKLIFIQSFRIIMELILWGLFLKNIIPVQMTFEGRNFDVIAGLMALLVGYLVWKKISGRKLIIAYNILGLILLANIVIIALLSAPTPLRQFMNEPANTIIVYFPFVWLPGFVVPVAYTMHFLSLKKALRSSAD